MKTLVFFAIGVLFGITLYMSEVSSWFRIYEMFQFNSFHMYGGHWLCLVFWNHHYFYHQKIETQILFGQCSNYLPQKRERLETLSVWGNYFWWWMGPFRSLSRSDVFPFGSRVSSHCHCHFLCNFWYFYLRFASIQTAALKLFLKYENSNAPFWFDPIDRM